MNFQLWLETLRSSIRQWRRSKEAVYVASMKIKPRASAELLARTQRQLALALPEDLAAFYLEAAGACDIQFAVVLPANLELTRDECTVNQFSGGFGLLALSKLATSRLDWCDLLESLPNDDPARLQMFVRFGIPIWIDRGSSFIVCVNRDAGANSGIYCMDYGSLPETKSHPKLANSFTEWLDFLEQSCYAEVDAHSFRLWHDGHKLARNEIFRQRILEAIKLNRPREEAAPFLPREFRERYAESIARNPKRADESLLEWIGRIRIGA
jgi:hypothetical protein